MLVDTVFEMNYSTGQWTRLKKYKPITNTSWDASPCCSKSHTQNFLPTSKQNMYTHKYLRTRLGQIKHWAGERSSRRERSSLFLRRQNAGLFEEHFCTFCLVVPLTLFIVSVFKSPSIPEWCCGQKGWESEQNYSHTRHLSTFVLLMYKHVTCLERKESRLYFSVWMWHSQLIFDIWEQNHYLWQKEWRSSYSRDDKNERWVVINAVSSSFWRPLINV